MNSRDLKQDFEELLRSGGQAVNSLSVEQGVRQMLEFFRNHRCGDRDGASGGDMLLFQWGSYGDGPFVLDVTRQLIVDSEDDDEGIWQLSLTLEFDATSPLKAIAPGNKWCRAIKPQAIDYFEKFIRDSEAYRAVAALAPRARSLEFANAG